MVKLRNFFILAGVGLCSTGVAYMVMLGCKCVCENICNAVTKIVDTVYNSEE